MATTARLVVLSVVIDKGEDGDGDGGDDRSIPGTGRPENGRKQAGSPPCVATSPAVIVAMDVDDVCLKM